jgi:hypothetical protein
MARLQPGWRRAVTLEQRIGTRVIEADPMPGPDA